MPVYEKIPYNNLNALENKLSDPNFAAFMFEPIQGEAGVIVPDEGYLEQVRNLCTKFNVLMIADEIQTGIGRTGKMFAFENYKIIADILVIGKAFGGGFPIGALISDRKLLSKFISNPELGDITTFGGHPVIASAGLKTLQIILNSF